MNRKLIIASFIALFSACSSPHIQKIDNHTLQIVLDDKKVIKGYGKVVYENRINLSNINIYQQVYKMDSGIYLTYEDATVATGYKYNFGVSRTVDIVFSDYNSKIINNKGNIYFIELTNYSEKMYLILENINKKRLKLIYGFNKELFIDLYKTLIKDDNIILKSLKPKNKHSISKPQEYINSSWNQRNIILDGIITKVGGGKYGR
jgi:hypothetical protein